MKHKAIISLLILSVSLLLVACTQQADDINPDGSVNISFFGWGSAEEQENYQQLINLFMEQNEDIRVTYNAVSSDQYMRTLRNRINNLPDVFYIPDTEFLQWADAGRLLDLDAYITTEDLSDVWPAAAMHYRYNRQTFTLGEGGLYALPKDLGPFAMVMNVDLFNRIVDENNLDIERPNPDIPMTWQEFIDLTTALNGTYNNTRVYGVTHYELAAAVYSNNANFISEDGQTQTITDQNFIDAVQFIADLDLVHGVMPNANDQASTNGFQRFMNSGGVFSFMGPWDLTGFWRNVNFEFDLIPMPVGPAEGAQSTAWVGSMGIAVSERSRQKEAAARLAKFLTIQEDSQRLAYQLGQAVPNLQTIARDEFLENIGLEGREVYPVNKQMFISIIEGNEHIAGKPRIQYYTYNNVWYDEFLDALLPVYTNQRTAQQLMNDYAATLQAALDESNSYLQ